MLIAAVSAYLKETGDFSILNEMVDFDNQKEKQHLCTSICAVLSNIQPLISDRTSCH